MTIKPVILPHQTRCYCNPPHNIKGPKISFYTLIGGIILPRGLMGGWMIRRCGCCDSQVALAISPAAAKAKLARSEGTQAISNKSNRIRRYQREDAIVILIWGLVWEDELKVEGWRFKVEGSRSSKVEGFGNFWTLRAKNFELWTWA